MPVGRPGTRLRLATMPPEITDLILDELRFVDFKRLSQVSKEWKTHAHGRLFATFAIGPRRIDRPFSCLNQVKESLIGAPDSLYANAREVVISLDEHMSLDDQAIDRDAKTATKTLNLGDL